MESEEKRRVGKRIRYAKTSFQNTLKQVAEHTADFWIVWAIIAALVVLAYLCHVSMTWIYILEGVFVVYIILKPMGAVYALVGASTSLRSFLLNFILISMAFVGIYYGLFFRNAGICFDTDIAQIDYDIFKDRHGERIIEIPDTTKLSFFEERIVNGVSESEMVIQTKVETLNYHRITLGLVIENTLITSLTQDPSDLYYVISDLGENMNAISTNKEITRLFTYILLLHILVSWLFLGVFISLVYSKFRYEA